MKPDTITKSLFRAMLRVYPGTFQRNFGEKMEETFACVLGDVSQRRTVRVGLIFS